MWKKSKLAIHHECKEIFFEQSWIILLCLMTWSEILLPVAVSGAGFTACCLLVHIQRRRFLPFLTWFLFLFCPLPQKIDEESEANLLAVLTETLDSIPVDEDGLPSFDALTDGDVTNENAASPSPMPDGAPPTQEAEEPSLVRTLPTVYQELDVPLATRCMGMM